MDNFDIVWQRQFQSSSSQVTIINGQTKSINTTTYTIVLSLSAKKAWTYTIWPAIIDVWWKEYKTNTVQVKVSWAKIMLNNTQNYQANTNQQLWNQQVHNPVWQARTINQQVQQQSKIKDFEKEVTKTKIDNNQNIFLLLWILILIWFVVVMYILNNEKNNDFETITEDNSYENEATKVDFEKNELEYPNLDDKDFEVKLDKVFREKLKQRFGISNVDKKTYKEILDEIWENDIVKEIINLLKLLKYSNLVADREKALMLVKEL